MPERPFRDELERHRQVVKAARVWARTAHPFDRSRPQDATVDVYDDQIDSDAALVAFPGAADRMWIPAVDFFDPIADWRVRRIFVRRLAPSVHYQHELGTDVPEIAASLRQRLRDHRRTVFIGTSLGGFHALLFGTLVGADAVVAVNPVTSLLPDVLEEAGDNRYDVGLEHISPAWLTSFGDLPALWERHEPPRTLLHYAYRDKAYCVQAEHIAGLAHVTPCPHFEYSPMGKLTSNGELKSLLASLLWPESEPPLRSDNGSRLVRDSSLPDTGGQG